MDSSSNGKPECVQEKDNTPEQHQQPIIRVVNPYAASRSSKNISKAPKSNDVADTRKSPHFDAVEEHRPIAATAAVPETPANEEGNRSEESNTISEENRGEQSRTANESAASSAVRKSVGHLPPWQRLPSRNVTFGSAEILTVSELRTHGMIYVNRSVRITGVLLKRHVHTQPDGQALLLLVVGDSLDGARPAPARRNSLFARNPYNISATSSTGIKPRTGLVTKSSLAGKRKLVHRPKTPSASSSLLGKKRKLATTPKATPTGIESVLSCLSDQPSVLVIANPTHVQTNNVAVGDLILVMGEVHAREENTSKAATLVLNDLVERQKPLQQNKDENQTSRFCLQARILGNANGTDMKLHYETLKLRRKHMLDRNVQRPLHASDSPLIGCGPPPYGTAD